MSKLDMISFLSCFVIFATAFASQEYQASPSPITNYKLPRDCFDLQLMGAVESGIYIIYPVYAFRPVAVYCDLTTDGGGWLVFQRRQDGTVNFNRSWTEYERGFGSISGEFWLGNTYLHALTNYTACELRIDLEDWEGNTAFVKYATFVIGSSTNNYVIRIEGYSGNISDDLSLVSGLSFSTYDRDNDLSTGNCAITYPSGFWFNSCFYANLNGIYSSGSSTSYAIGIIWRNWKGYYYSLKISEMKLRPVQYTL